MYVLKVGSAFPVCDLLVSKYGCGVRLFGCLQDAEKKVTGGAVNS